MKYSLLKFTSKLSLFVSILFPYPFGAARAQGVDTNKSIAFVTLNASADWKVSEVTEIRGSGTDRKILYLEIEMPAGQSFETLGLGFTSGLGEPQIRVQTSQNKSSTFYFSGFNAYVDEKHVKVHTNWDKNLLPDATYFYLYNPKNNTVRIQMSVPESVDTIEILGKRSSSVESQSLLLFTTSSTKDKSKRAPLLSSDNEKPRTAESIQEIMALGLDEHSTVDLVKSLFLKMSLEEVIQIVNASQLRLAVKSRSISRIYLFFASNGLSNGAAPQKEDADFFEENKADFYITSAARGIPQLKASIDMNIASYRLLPVYMYAGRLPSQIQVTLDEYLGSLKPNSKTTDLEDHEVIRNFAEFSGLSPSADDLAESGSLIEPLIKRAMIESMIRHAASMSPARAAHFLLFHFPRLKTYNEDLTKKIDIESVIIEYMKKSSTEELFNSDLSRLAVPIESDFLNWALDGGGIYQHSWDNFQSSLMRSGSLRLILSSRDILSPDALTVDSVISSQRSDIFLVENKSRFKDFLDIFSKRQLLTYREYGTGSDLLALAIKNRNIAAVEGVLGRASELVYRDDLDNPYVEQVVSEFFVRLLRTELSDDTSVADTLFFDNAASVILRNTSTDFILKLDSLGHLRFELLYLLFKFPDSKTAKEWKLKLSSVQNKKLLTKSEIELSDGFVQKDDEFLGALSEITSLYLDLNSEFVKSDSGLVSRHINPLQEYLSGSGSVDEKKAQFLYRELSFLALFPSVLGPVKKWPLDDLIQKIPRMKGPDDEYLEAFAKTILDTIPQLSSTKISEQTDSPGVLISSFGNPFMAAILSGNETLIYKFIQMNPDNILIDMGGYNALTINNELSENVVNTLLNSISDISKLANVDRVFGIMLKQKRYRELTQLLKRFPELARIPNQDGFYPIHEYCYNSNLKTNFNAELELPLLRVLIDAYPESVQLKLSPTKNTPLHLLYSGHSWRSPDSRVVDMITGADPSVLLLRNESGQLPLEIQQK